jgi:hypothetical protein
MLATQSLDHGVNRLSVFCLGGDGMSLRAAGDHPIERIIVAGKKSIIGE